MRLKFETWQTPPVAAMAPVLPKYPTLLRAQIPQQKKIEDDEVAASSPQGSWQGFIEQKLLREEALALQCDLKVGTHLRQIEDTPGIEIGCFLQFSDVSLKARFAKLLEHQVQQI
mmetsp:Transcript_13643/g.15855  ORF Transcript_13643/g.15855 Transcript_13643/m.15855 type:complete len:115 (+) Transcript_13643:3-347(+)